MIRHDGGIEERHGLPEALRTWGGVGGHVGARHVIIVLLGLVGLVPAAAVAHEERLVVGRIETIDPARRLLMIVGVDGGERRRVELTPETEVLACRAAPGLAAVSAGGHVRVKYLEKTGSPSRAESILVLGGGP